MMPLLFGLRGEEEYRGFAFVAPISLFKHEWQPQPLQKNASVKKHGFIRN